MTRVWIKLRGGNGRAGVEVRLMEHKSDFRFHRTSNAVVLHIEKCDHLPVWDGTHILKKKHEQAKT